MLLFQVGNKEQSPIYVWGDWGQLQIFMGICALLLVTGLLNFINLYMIFMLKRTHEYGIRRVFGAGRGAVFAQIFAENFLLSALAVLLAWVCIELTRVPVSRFFGFDSLIQLSMGICPWCYLYSCR